MYPRILVAALVLAFSGLAPAADEAPAKPARPAKRAAPPAAPADEDLLGRTVFQALVGDFALREGDIDLSASAWVDLAQRTNDPKAMARAAEVLVIGRRYDQALVMVDNWLRVEPDSERARQLRSSLMVLSNRLDELGPQIGAMLAQEPAAIAGNLMQLNRVLARHGDKIAVQRLVDRVAAPYGHLPEAHFAMSQAAANAGDEARALAEVDQALALQPDWEPAALVRAQLLARKEGGRPAAIESLAPFVERNPTALDARLGLARLLIAERRFGEARTHFDRLVEQRPDSPDVIYPLAMLALQQGDMRLGRDQLEHLLQTDFPDKPTVHYYLGQLSEEARNPEQALGHYAQVTAGENYISARVRSAMLLQKQGATGEARALLHDTRGATAAEQGQLLLAEAQLLRDDKQPAAAYALLEKALAANPDDIDLRYEAALLADRIGKHEVMEKHLRRVLAIKPDHPHALNALGYSWADRNIRLAEAEKLIAKALALAPEDPFIMDSLGWVYFRQHRLAEAQATLARAYTLRADPEIAAHLGEVLWAMGRRDEARRLLEAAGRDNPGHEVLEPVIKKLLK